MIAVSLPPPPKIYSARVNTNAYQHERDGKHPLSCLPEHRQRASSECHWERNARSSKQPPAPVSSPSSREKGNQKQSAGPKRDVRRHIRPVNDSEPSNQKEYARPKELHIAAYLITRKEFLLC